VIITLAPLDSQLGSVLIWSSDVSGQFLTALVVLQGWTLSSRGELCPQGVLLTPSLTPVVNTLLCLEEWRGKQRVFISGWNFTPLGENFTPWVETSPPRIKLHPREKNFTPGGQLHPWGPKFAPGGQISPLRIKLHPWEVKFRPWGVSKKPASGLRAATCLIHAGDDEEESRTDGAAAFDSAKPENDRALVFLGPIWQINN
jgi:hypothetical protein